MTPISIRAVRSRAVLSLLAVAVLFLGGCTSNPADHGDDHDQHAEAHGIQLVHQGRVLYQVLDGNVTCDAAPCGVRLQTGQSLTNVEVAFLDDKGNEIHAEDLSNEFTMAFSIVNPGFAVVEQAGRFGLTFTGVVPGTTRMQVILNHDGHADLTTPPVSESTAITVTVTP